MFWIITNKVWLIGAILISLMGQPLIGGILVFIELWRIRKIIQSIPPNIGKTDIKNMYGQGHIKSLSTKEQIKKINEIKQKD